MANNLTRRWTESPYPGLETTLEIPLVTLTEPSSAGPCRGFAMNKSIGSILDKLGFS